MNDLLVVTGLSRRFGALSAVDDVDLVVPEGSRHALIGCNGAGKSTMLNLVAGTDRPSSGRIHFAGRDITRLRSASRCRAGIARTFQTPALLESMTVLDNLIVAGAPVRRRLDRSQRRRPRELAMESLEQLDIGDCGRKIAAGELPHGRRRLVELAIALQSLPRLLLLDEPAAGLTDTDKAQLIQRLRGLTTDVTVLLVEHHQDLVTAIADTVTVLHNGQVLTSGTPAEVAAHPRVAEVYLGNGATA